MQLYRLQFNRFTDISRLDLRKVQNTFYTFQYRFSVTISVIPQVRFDTRNVAVLQLYIT